VTFASRGPVTPRPADKALASLVSPDSPGFETFRILRAKVKTLGDPRPFRCIGLVSATPQEGTSLVALGLAAALAQERDRRVLLVEAGLRAPALERRLGLSEEPGLGEWLSAGSDDPVPLRSLEPWGLSLLAAGVAAPPSAEILGGESMARLMSAARLSFDFVVLDCPALETGADSVILQDLVDGFLLVARARHASRDAIRRALSHLRPGVIQGVVFNDRTELLARWLDRHRHPAKP
jgi:Mrp family chromosome partitioning ATPase